MNEREISFIQTAINNSKLQTEKIKCFWPVAIHDYALYL